MFAAILPWRQNILPNDADFEIVDIPDNTSTTDAEIFSISDDSSAFGIRSISDFSDPDDLNTIDARNEYLICREAQLEQQQEREPHLKRRTNENAGASIDEVLLSTIPRKDALAMERAGRGDGSHTFKDMRSPTRASDRQHSELKKYYNYRAVKPGQLNMNHYVRKPGPKLDPTLQQDRPVQPMNKRSLYQEAQNWPKPPKYSKGRRHRGDGTWSNKVEARWHAARQANIDIDDAEDEQLGLEIDLYHIRMDVLEETVWNPPCPVQPVLPSISLGDLLVGKG